MILSPDSDPKKIKVTPRLSEPSRSEENLRKFEPVGVHSFRNPVYLNHNNNNVYSPPNSY